MVKMMGAVRRWNICGHPWCTPAWQDRKNRRALHGSLARTQRTRENREWRRDDRS